jgi:D-aminopeptidase
LPPAVTSNLIEESAKRAVINLRSKKAPKPFKVSKPIKLTLEFQQSEMADRAAFMPHTKRGDDRCVEYVADDMITIYLAFRALQSLAR